MIIPSTSARLNGVESASRASFSPSITRLVTKSGCVPPSDSSSLRNTREKPSIPAPSHSSNLPSRASTECSVASARVLFRFHDKSGIGCIIGNSNCAAASAQAASNTKLQPPDKDSTRGILKSAKRDFSRDSRVWCRVLSITKPSSASRSRFSRLADSPAYSTSTRDGPPLERIRGSQLWARMWSRNHSGRGPGATFSCVNDKPTSKIETPQSICDVLRRFLNPPMGSAQNCPH